MGLCHRTDRFFRLFSLAVLALFGLGLAATEAMAAKWIVVSVSEAPIQIGDRTIGTARRAERFEVMDERDGFYKVEFTDADGEQRRGWISRRSVAVEGGSSNTEETLGSLVEKLRANALEQQQFTEAMPVAERQLWAEPLELHRQQRFTEAMPVAERLVAFYAKGDQKPGPRAVDALYLLAGIQSELQQYGKAQCSYEKAMLASLDANGPAAYRTLACLVGLAEIAHFKEQISVKRHCLRLCFQQKSVLDRDMPGRSHDPLRDANWRLRLVAGDEAAYDYSYMAVSSGDSSYSLQLPMFRDHLPEIRRWAVRPPASARLAEAEYLTDLALLLCRLNHADRALAIAQRGQALRRAETGEQSPEYADSLHVLALLDLEQGQCDACRGHCHEALKRLGGADAETVPTAIVLHTLMLAECRAGRLDEAKHAGRRAEQVYARHLGENHPSVVQSRIGLANVCALQKNVPEALRLYDLAVHGHHVEATAQWTLPEDQLAARSPHNSGAVAFAVETRGSTQIANASAEWLMNFKGLLTERRAGDTVEQRAVRNLPNVDPITHPDAFRNYQRDGMQALIQGLKAGVLHNAVLGHRESVLRWVTPEQITAMQQADQRAREMMASVSSVASPKKRRWSWVTLTDVRRRLPADTWLLEFARYQVADAAGGEGASQYAVWVIPPASRGDVQIIPLGPARDIEPLIEVVQKAGGRVDAITPDSEATVEAAWREDATRLAKRVLWPVIEPLPKEAAHLLLAPDSALWNIPWCALPLPDGQYAIERKAIDYVVSERSLAATPPSDARPGPAAILAAPDYDAARSDVAEAAWQRMHTSYQAMTDYGRFAGLPKAPPLPGTWTEAKAIAPHLAQITGSEPLRYTGILASEGIFLGLQSPRVLVVSTHGFYYDKPLIELRSPLVRCGLVLAGYNNRRSGEPTLRREAYGMLGDGVLAGDEIVGVDLSATELVVLSACKTAVGHATKNGEVESLRQSFHIAGAQRVVATLWPIPDRETVQLMKAFFRRLADGHRPEDALRDAQLEIIRLRRQRHGAAHPAYWAAFGMTLSRIEPDTDSGPPAAAEDPETVGATHGPPASEAGPARQSAGGALRRRG